MGLPICTNCDIERVLTEIEPARRNYVIRTISMSQLHGHFEGGRQDGRLCRPDRSTEKITLM
jgi:hypothetical protein